MMGLGSMSTSLQLKQSSFTARARSPATSRGISPIKCAAAPRNQMLVNVVETLFRLPPIFNMAAANARKMIIDRGTKLGLDFARDIEELKQVDWDEAMKEVTNPAVTFPDYYTKPFHAYPNGNLCLEAALEVTSAAKSVHSTVMDPTGKTLDPEGDAKLRSSYSKCMVQQLEQAGAKPVKQILDVGCATGLSSLELLEALPGAEVTGIDLSPQFLAVGKYMQQQRQQNGSPEKLTFMHGAAEATGLPSESFDLVSMCLVCHELPEAASRAIFKEAYRLLRPGGSLSIMEMNPASPAFQRVLSNPVPYVVFKSTEPWLIEYVGMDMHQAIEDSGFQMPTQLENSPRHRTVVAVKK